MRAADLVTAGVLFLIGAVVVFDSMRLGIGWGSDGPKSGFFPFWLACGMMLACAAVGAQAARRAQRVSFVTAEQLGPVVKVLAPALGLVLATELIGLYVASALYIGFYMRWIGRHRWVTIAALALGMPLLTFVV